MELLKEILLLHDKFSGLNRKVQFKPIEHKGTRRVTQVQVVAKWGGEITKFGREQAQELGCRLRVGLYPGDTLLALHSTFRHNFKLYSSLEGRCQVSSTYSTEYNRLWTWAVPWIYLFSEEEDQLWSWLRRSWCVFFFFLVERDFIWFSGVSFMNLNLCLFLAMWRDVAPAPAGGRARILKTLIIVAPPPGCINVSRSFVSATAERLCSTL